MNLNPSIFPRRPGLRQLYRDVHQNRPGEIYSLQRQKFSFYIENEPKLTYQLLATVKTKRVKEKDIHFAVEGIFNLIEKNLLTTKKVTEMEKKPIIELAELVQKQFGANIETRVTGKTGADHMPTVSIEIELPDGRIFEASGTNKRIAKQKAAEKALTEF